MLELLDYITEETLYKGPETCVRRVRQRSTGEALVVKQPVADSPSLRTVRRLLHEHQILARLVAVPGGGALPGAHPAGRQHGALARRSRSAFAQIGDSLVQTLAACEPSRACVG